jgi:predicted DNA-binding transcriptional regulator
MHKDQVIGTIFLMASVIVIVAYIWLAFFPPLPGADIFLLKLTGSVAVTAIFAIFAWIGYTLATTPPPKPIEEIPIEEERSGEEATEQQT